MYDKTGLKNIFYFDRKSIKWIRAVPLCSNIIENNYLLGDRLDRKKQKYFRMCLQMLTF